MGLKDGKHGATERPQDAGKGALCLRCVLAAVSSHSKASVARCRGILSLNCLMCRCKNMLCSAWKT